MRKLFGTFIVLVLCLVMANQALAAETYPVHLRDQDKTVQAIVRSNVTYLPMRTLFEGCNATVSWDEGKQLITAWRADDAVLKIDMRKNTLEITEQGQTSSSKMPQNGFIRNGVTYLPLRFIGENLHCRILWTDEWTGDKEIFVDNCLIGFKDSQGQNFLVDLTNGRLYQKEGGGCVYLGSCGINDFLKLDSTTYTMPYSWELGKTANGSYIMQCEYGFNGAMIHSVDFVSYMSKAGQQTYCMASEGDLFWQYTGDKFYLVNEKGFLVSVDDVSGQADQLELATMLAGVAGAEGIESIVPLAVDGDYIFFRSNSRTNLLMFDRAAKKLADFRDILITDEVIAAYGMPADSDGWSENFAPNEYMLELGPRFVFIKLEDGVMYVELRNYDDTKIIPLEYRYR